MSSHGTDPHEVRVEYESIPNIYRDIDNKLISNGIRVSGMASASGGGSESGRATFYLFLEFLGL